MSTETKTNGINGHIETEFRDKFYTDLLPKGDEKLTEEFLFKLVKRMFLHIKQSYDTSNKVLDFHYPEDLQKLMNFDLTNEPEDLESIYDHCESILKYSVKTANPRFFNQLYQGLDIISLLATWLTDLTNTSIYTYEVAPVYIVMEKYTIRKMIEVVGWKDGDGDGIFSPGGSISNLYAVQVAKHARFPEAKREGFFNMPKLAIFTSKHAHYSIKNVASILGIGSNQVKAIPVDERGKIIPEELEKKIVESIKLKEVPFIVCLTAGTTVLGAFDPIDAVSKICKKYNLWLHIDAAWGGGALLSKRLRHLVHGIEEADSVTWNPHKMMNALLQTSAILIKKPGLLMDCNALNASYLFQKDKHYDTEYDIGNKSIQCGRHVDVCKIWLMWKAKGDQGFEKHIDYLHDLAQHFCSEIRKRPNFRFVLENPEFMNICFWYVPQRLLNSDPNSDEYKREINKIAPQIKKKMMLEGSLMIGYQPLDEHPNFFRLAITNPATTNQDLNFVLDEIQRLGKNL